jgi:hypothetical protein
VINITTELQYLRCKGQDRGEEGVQHAHWTILQPDNLQLLVGEGQYLADQIEYVMRPYGGTGRGREGKEKRSLYVAA